MTSIYKHSVGITFEVSTGMDLTDATDLQILIRKPSNKTATWQASILGDITAGVITYTTVDGDLNEDGWHYLQSYAEFPSTIAYYGNAVRFKVLDNYEVP